MNLTIHSSDLSRALTAVKPVISPRAPMAILSDVLLDASAGQVRVTGSNLDVMIATNVQAGVTTPGRICVPHAQLADAVRAVKPQDLTLTSDGARLVVKTATGQFTLPVDHPDQYPDAQDHDGERITVTADGMRHLIAATTFACSQDDLRPSMHGVFLTAWGTDICAVATDGHRLSRTVVPFTGGPLADCIIPLPVLSAFERVITGDEIGMRLSQTHVTLDAGATTITARLIAETYPKWESVVPTDNPHTLTVDRRDLLAASQRCAVFSHATTHQLRMAIEPSRLTLTASDDERGVEATEVIGCESTTSMLIGFNADYVIEAMQHMDADEVEFKIGAPTRGVTLAAKDPDQTQVRMLLMPLRLS